MVTLAQPLNILSMCSGIGGLDLGLKLALGDAARTVCYVEREAYCASVLQARIEDGHLDDAPIWDDATTFDSGPWRGVVDLITAGYPCQPFSVSGARRGTDDPRHLWPFLLRHIEAIEPAFVFCENVPGHLTLGFEQVCEDLSGLGYSLEAGIFSAAELGAPHIRKRLYFLAHAQGSGRQAWGGDRLRAVARSTQGSVARAACSPWNDEPSAVADASGPRCAEGGSGEGGPVRHQTRWAQPQRRGGDVADTCARWADPAWAALTDVGRIVSDGLPHRVDRLRALGNAVVPQVAAYALEHLLGQAQAS